MNSKTQSLLVGLAGGVASALLILGSGDLSPLSVLLSACATLPVLIAGLGWSNFAGAVAVLTGSIVIAAAISPLGALMVAVTTLLPAAWIAHLSNLARPAEEIGGPQGKLAWYPLSDIMLHICGLVSLSLIILGYAVGYGEEIIRPVVENVFAILAEQNPEAQVDAEVTTEMVAFMTRVLPALQSAMWVIILFTAWYLACGIVRVSGRSRRPADFIPAALRMSRLGLLVFGAGLALSFVGGAAGLIGSVVSGAFAGGFMLAGIAMLHHRTLGRAWRFVALWFAYVATFFLFPLPLIVFLFAGLFETARTSPLSATGPPPNDPNDPSNSNNKPD
ncbi:DUF2232 domain-containing protein [Nitratireductor sp. XY-223]|uniref:DUF2232 domain-containing protein n=1 Tax=Nitratireductor sp. XY-223 TaxID=2561926 RepID=UPI0010AB1262|nr:DUF2232 domain-containing protein [Nitratireductor sp. XY-223]